VLADEWQDVMTALATTVRDVRRLLGWSQQQLADQAVVSQGTISRMETGRCGAIPFHSVVVVLRTLAAGAAALQVPLSPTVVQMLAFAPSLNGGFTTIDPLNPDLAYIAQTLQRIPRSDRPRFLTIVRAAATAFDIDDAPTPGD
jgi:transcriptional regulator with XRE-family HTH domain